MTKRGAKRSTRDGEEVPSGRLRTKDTEEMHKEEEARRQREIEEQKRRDEGSDEEDSWEDDGDDGDLEDIGVEEEEIIEASDDDDDEYAEFQKESSARMTKGMRSISFKDVEGAEDAADDEAEGNGAAGEVSVWRGDIEDGAADGVAGGEPAKLEFSNKAYDAFFQLRTEYPCLSFDVVKDNKDNHTKYPLSTLLVCGTQANEQARNELLVLYVSNMCRTKHDVASDNDSEEDFIGDDESEGDEDDEAGEDVNDGEPVVHHRVIKHYGSANRVRCCPQNNPAGGSQLVAVWSDAGHVQVFDIESEMRALTDFSNWSKEQAQQWKQPSASASGNKKQQSLKFCTPSTSHKTEGYGLDWSPVQANAFASGDCAGSLFVWQPTEDGRWKNVASSTASGAMSIEEIQWSPTQADVLITARAGGVVEVWDTRDMRACKITLQADPSDINVADWNRARQASHLLVTGAESGAVAVWDLRRIGADPNPIQRIALHKKAITSVEFAPHNESVLSVASDDGRCTLWDLSLERDVNEEQEAVGELFSGKLKEYPDQLMFQHQGLVHPKEAHWHMQIPGLLVTTDYEGLNLFRPMNWKSLMR